MNNQPPLFRKALVADLPAILALLRDDELGSVRENESITPQYLQAFERIAADPAHYLLVCELHDSLIATCHLTLLPSLTFQGALRCQIEAVRVSSSCRGQGIGEQLLQHALAWARAQGVILVQLMTNKARTRAHAFYEKLGFCATHEGMKLWLS